MNPVLHMEYKALNLLDEVCSVEIAIMEDKRELHILDIHKAVSPVYHFGRQAYEFTDDFYRMIQVLMSKKILFSNNCKEMDEEQWLHQNTIYFYSENSNVITWGNHKISAFKLASIEITPHFYLPYLKRVTGFL